jgi:hypothetical protein
MEKNANPLISFIANYCSSFYIFKNIKMQTELSVNQTVADFEIRVGMVPIPTTKSTAVSKVVTYTRS